MNKVEINELVSEIHDNNLKSGWWLFNLKLLGVKNEYIIKRPCG